MQRYIYTAINTITGIKQLLLLFIMKITLFLQIISFCLQIRIIMNNSTLPVYFLLGILTNN